ncbi:hypothetical protein ACFFGR_16530 [Arthrobacter liuii]|uniref:Uncharacterized protein n=1 Tax=Arthrobacter liuii TaxID=1476996 RepID=A0ABQ2AWL0_9MICC|nr:hypothetical protein [Arthrobacter liuii]GGH98119.1 hypothetical protein GCM10007170_29930 [Arthrobacter liuii]
MKIAGWRIGTAVLFAAVCMGLSACQGHPVLSAGTVHFTASADMGTGSGVRSVLDVVARLEPDFKVALGDFSYEAGAE